MSSSARRWRRTMVLPSTPAGTFAGTVAVITGGASGIGQATAEAFVAAGARVVLFDRDGERLARTVAAFGPAATGVTGDVSNWDDCQAAASAAEDLGEPVR